MVLVSNLAMDGGAEGQAVQLALRLKARGWSVLMVSMLPPQGEMSPLLKQGIPLFTLGGRSKLQAGAFLLRLARIVRRHRPHIVHAHMSHAILLARLLRMVQPVPVLMARSRPENVQRPRNRVAQRELLNGLTDRLSDATSVVCEAARAALSFVARGIAERGCSRSPTESTSGGSSPIPTGGAPFARSWALARNLPGSRSRALSAGQGSLHHAARLCACVRNEFLFATAARRRRAFGS